MILSSVVIAGALGAGTLGVSIKAYREEKRKREFPWTVAAERMAKKERALIKGRKRTPFYGQGGVIGRVTSSIIRVRAKSQALTEEIVAPFVGDTRHQQLQEITASKESVEVSEAEKETRRYLKIASAGLLLATGGTLFYTPLYVPSTLCALYVYRVFYKAAYEGLKKGRLNAYMISTLVTIGGLMAGFFWATALGIWSATLMRLLLIKTEDHSRKSLVNLFGTPPRFVWIVVDESEIQIPFENLQKGDILVVMAGQMIPVDGTISAGQASVDQQMLTGEAQPCEKEAGDSVFASTVVLSGKIYLRVEKTGQETVSAQIGDILNHTADFKLSIQSRVESLQEKIVPAFIALSAASLPWLRLNGALAILWYTPAWRMVILASMGMLNFLHLSSRCGLLIKDGKSLELLSDIDTIVFDKTGTLTQEMPYVSQIYTLQGTEDEILTLAAAAEQRQTHPIARAILVAAEARQLRLPKIDDAHVEIGYGVKVKLNEQVVRIGSDRFMAIENIAIPLTVQEQQESCHAQGYSLVYLAIDEQLAGAIELRPTIRPEAKEVIRELREKGKRLYIISGDHEAPTRQLAQELGIDQYFANTLPENKANLVSQLQEEGRSVCFVGDGINDSIALKKANVSISLRGATTIATDTAQVVLMDGSLEQLTFLFDIADDFKRNQDKTYMMTIVPNLMGIGGTFLFHWGFLSAVTFSAFLWLPQLGVVMLPLYKHQTKKAAPHAV